MVSEIMALVSNHLVTFNFIVLFLILITSYNSLSSYYWAIIGYIFIFQFSPPILVVAVYTSVVVVFIVPKLRKVIVTKQIIALIKYLKLLPKISDTEKTALNSGTVWVDGELFSGKPDFKWIFSQSYPNLTKEEELFLSSEVEEVCKMCCDDEVQKSKDLPPEVWQYLKDKKFFGLIIPKRYGGLGFSAFAHSCIVEKLSSRSIPLAITAMVPNSLGPAELLLHYGTKEQKNYYLPRLAIGKEIPCFALTEPMAGSDATSITSTGLVFRDVDGKLKIKLNWNKRYITLGSVATLIGLAFQMRDPNNLLGLGEDIGITCSLIPNKTKGVEQGRRHNPLNTHFINSPINGKDVIIGLDSIIGGQENAGKGWKMLMECLAAGRGISLPSVSCGGAKLVTRAMTAYSVIRQQFGLSIGKFEGVETVLARIIGKTYILEAMRCFTAGAIDAGSKPAVITAIAKYHSTQMARQVINDGMDIAGGSGIIKGKRNLLANIYSSIPISITVEGANIMTRGLIHFGQGAVMCHPFAYKEMQALEANDLEGFDKAIFSHLAHLTRNKSRAIILGLTRGYLHKTSSKGIAKKYERKLAWASAHFAFLADIAIIKFGGNLKRKEKLNGRFGDILSTMYMAVCILKKFDVDGSKKDDELLIKCAMADLFNQMQEAFDGIWRNIFTSRIVKIVSSPAVFLFKINRFSCQGADALEGQLVQKALKSGDFRNNLTKGIYIPKDNEQQLARFENTLKLFEEMQNIFLIIKNASQKGVLPKEKPENLVDLALAEKVISKKEVIIIKKAQETIYDAVAVDEYSSKEYKNI